MEFEEYLGENSKIFPCVAYFCVFDEMFIEVP